MLWYDLNILYFPGFRRYRRRNRIHTSRKAHRLWSHRQEAATNLRTVTRKKHHDAIGPVCRPAQRVANALCALLCITSCCVLPAGWYVCVCVCDYCTCQVSWYTAHLTGGACRLLEARRLVTIGLTRILLPSQWLCGGSPSGKWRSLTRHTNRRLDTGFLERSPSFPPMHHLFAISQEASNQNENSPNLRIPLRECTVCYSATRRSPGTKDQRDL